jgi:hypothetical protein
MSFSPCSSRMSLPGSEQKRLYASGSATPVHMRRIPLFLYCAVVWRCISGDVAVDVVCVLPSSAFPTSVYDSVVQRLAGAALASPTTLRADLITGASARSLYFPNSTAIHRFQLLHITRVASRLDGTADMRALRAGLVSAVASSVGLCGFDEAAGAEDVQQAGTLEMPTLVALVASVGWIITLILCAGCWACHLCCAPSAPVVPSAEVVLPVSPNHNIPIAITTNPSRAASTNPSPAVATLTRPEAAAPPASKGGGRSMPPSRAASWAGDPPPSRRGVVPVPGTQSRRVPVIVATSSTAAVDSIDFDRRLVLPASMNMRMP